MSEINKEYWNRLPGVSLNPEGIVLIQFEDGFLKGEDLLQLNTTLIEGKKLQLLPQSITILKMNSGSENWFPLSEEYRILYNERLFQRMNLHVQLSIQESDSIDRISKIAYYLILINYNTQDRVTIRTDLDLVSILDLNPYGNVTLNNLMLIANKTLSKAILPVQYTISEEYNVIHTKLEA